MPISSEPIQQPVAAATTEHSRVLGRIAERAQMLDAAPGFPQENFADLRNAGLLGRLPGGFAAEVELVRAVAAADASTARILDGHLNGLERLALLAGDSAAAEIADDNLLLGVWGADPTPSEGSPARLVRSAGGCVLDGVKTFCSGAGGVHRALVVASAADGSRRLVYVDAVDSRMEIDRNWYCASGLRASESHLVRFHALPVLCVLGGADELSREPYFSRDAIRTTSTWVGLVDAILTEVTKLLHARSLAELTAYRLGQLRIAVSTIGCWFERTVGLLAQIPAVTSRSADPMGASSDITTALECRLAVSQCARTVLTLSAELGGSHALIGGSRLDRARRDLDLFLLQHRLDPKLVSLGMDLLKARS